jgi:hypothetical protein
VVACWSRAARSPTRPYHPSDWALVRDTAEGIIDCSFGADDIVRTDFGTGADQGAALALTPAGAVVAGEIYASLGVARYLTPGCHRDDGFE